MTIQTLSPNAPPSNVNVEMTDAPPYSSVCHHNHMMGL